MSHSNANLERGLESIKPASHSTRSIDFGSSSPTVQCDSARASNADLNLPKAQPGDEISGPQTVERTGAVTSSPTANHLDGIDHPHFLSQPSLADAIRARVLSAGPMTKPTIETLETERSPSSCYEQEGREERKALLTSQISVTRLSIREKKLQVKDLAKQLKMEAVREGESKEEGMARLEAQMVRVQQSIRVNALQVKELKKQLKMEEVHETEGRRREQDGKLRQQCRDFLRIAWDVSWM